ncbi:MAG TPA: tetratricopeptide repeat protein, partial [Chloroflexota bacterium]|nr:tetratricopeptide repeat protein [Chloroflexota bacterium]
LEEVGPEGYRFAHDVIREVVEEDLGAARRASLHRRVAEVLEGESGHRSVEALAYHFARSDAWSKAVFYLEQAGDRAAAQYAGSTAEHFYRAALERLDEHGCDLDGARVREKLADVFSCVTRYEEALAALSRAAACYRSAGDLEGLGRVTARRGMVYADKRAPAEGLACVEPFLSQYEAALSLGTRARLYLAVGRLSFVCGQFEEQLAAAARAAEFARAARDTRTLISAEMHRSWALTSLSRSREAIQAWEATIRLAETEGDPRLLSSILADASTFYEDMGEFTKERDCTERVLQEAAPWGDSADLAHLHTRHGMSAFFQGNWPEARHYFEQSVAICRRIELSWVSAWSLLDLGRLCVHEGRW